MVDVEPLDQKSCGPGNHTEANPICKQCGIDAADEKQELIAYHTLNDSEVLRKTGLYLREGEPYLSDEDLNRAVVLLMLASDVLRPLEGYGIALRALVQDLYTLQGIQHAMKYS